jgi:hypothetical protein
MDKEIEELRKEIEKIERENELSKLKERLAKLEEIPHKISHKRENNDRIRIIVGGVPYKPIEQNLQGGMRDLGNQMEGIPHIIIGKKDKKKLEFQPSQQLPPQLPLNQPNNIFNPKEQKILDRLKKWGLIIAILAITGYAAYRLLKGWLI